MKPDITVLLHPDEITLMHTVYPFLTSRHRRRFRFLTNPERALAVPAGEALCIIRLKRLVENGNARREFLSRARQRFRRLIAIDNNASAGALLKPELEACDLYYKRSVYADRSLYTRPVHSGRLFVDYYVRRGEVEPEGSGRKVPHTADLSKLRLLWNIGIGSYPRSRARKGAALRLARAFGPASTRHVYRDPRRYTGATSKVPAISARFGTRFDIPGITYHRTRFESRAQGDSRFFTGKVPLSQYNRELRSACGVLSPFGYGEECLRDFEAVLNGAALVKPDMSHLETWPDIYRAGDTYVPCAWDSSDLSVAAEQVCGHLEYALSIAANARAVLGDAYEKLDERVASFISEVLG